MSTNKKRGRGKKRNKKNTTDRYKGEGNTVFHMSATEATLAQMPYIDGYVCRGGVHGDTKYNRRKEKEILRRDIDDGLSG